ncbi:MAG: DUF1214 domain-containing protein [Pseudorhodoplanes sp.]|uniref:DUF1214 domain-containing protein n=1 Tax=Pseudorhodoplanes sp. TaxID=1934341 RepID=UPI003D11FE34
MRLLIGLLLAFAVAASVGLGTTLYALHEGTPFGSFTVGAWTSWPRTGTPDIDPYARALIARSGELPMGAGDGIAFVATKDDNGATLDGRCDVVVSGVTPQARYWTMTLYDPEGRLVGNSLKRHGFSSAEVVRKSDGAIEIFIAPRARDGNWLPSGGVERYMLVMRFYDSPIGVATRTGRETPMPAVKVLACS